MMHVCKIAMAFIAKLPDVGRRKLNTVLKQMVTGLILIEICMMALMWCLGAASIFLKLTLLKGNA